MSTSNPYLTVDQQIVGDIFTNTEVMDNLTVLCDEFGSRFGGTEGERLAAEFMRDKLMAYGLQNVHLEESPPLLRKNKGYSGYRPGG